LANGENNNTAYLYSDDPRFARLPDTPAPVICEFCGNERRTRGFDMLGARIMWLPGGTEPCSCSEGAAEYERKRREEDERRQAEEKAKTDAKTRERVCKIIGESGMGERFLRRTFESFIADTTGRKKIAEAARQYADNFADKLPKRGEPLPGRNGFLITGPKGTGKTHIAASIANSLMSRGTAVICMTERNLLGRIRQTYNRDEYTDESAVRRVYETVPLLVIDDLGKEKATEWTLATLYAVIDGRYDRAMPIIITANYDTEALVTRLTPTGGDRTTAKAIADRLAEMCKSIVMTGDSWRSK
jgi:DNA replication protein DnaC